MRIWERGAQSNSLGRAWEVSTRFRASWVALWLGCLGGARGKELLRNPDWLVGDRLFGERVGNETLGGVLLFLVAPRDRACTRRDRTGGGAIALPRCGNGVLRSNARSGPIPLQPGLSRGGEG